MHDSRAWNLDDARQVYRPPLIVVGPTTADALRTENKLAGIVEVLNALLGNSVRISSEFVTADESSFNPAAPALDPEVALNNLIVVSSLHQLAPLQSPDTITPSRCRG